MHEKRVLIVEPHQCHYEVIPSIVYYFQYMGYTANLLVQKNFVEQDVFCRFKSIENIFITKYAVGELQRILRTSEIRTYDFVFFNSYEYFHDDKKERLLDYLGYVPQSKYGILGIIHNKELLNDNDIPYLTENRIFALTPFEYKGYQVNLLSASFFGEKVNKKDIPNHEKIRFLMVGNSNKRILLEAALNGNDNSRFEIGHIGRINLNREFTHRILKHFVYFLTNRKKYEQNKFHYKAWKSIKYYGRLDFSSMYNMIEDTDYIMIVMDSNNPDHVPFLNGKTSGAKQLVLGFNKPCLVCEEFGRAFGFDESNAVLYKDNKLENGLKYASELSRDDYLDIKHNLGLMYDNVIAESKRNLSESIAKIIARTE